MIDLVVHVTIILVFLPYFALITWQAIFLSITNAHIIIVKAMNKRSKK